MHDLLDLIRDDIFANKITDRKNSVCFVKLTKMSLSLWYYWNKFTRNPLYDHSDSSTDHLTLKT